MHALVIERFTPAPAPIAPSVRFATDWPEPPAPGPGQARVRTLCSALNHLDLWTARGQPGTGFGTPYVGGSDACGIVESVGAGVDGAWVGKKVILNAAVDVGESAGSAGRAAGDWPLSAPNYRVIGEHSPGTHAEMFVAPVHNLQSVPESADPVECAALGLTFLTAYSMMFTKGGLKPGMWVLITGIGGGVALAALALARHAGARAIVTSRSAAKLERAKMLGAEFGVLDAGGGGGGSGKDFSSEVRAITGKRGVDMAVDSNGKATHLACIKSLARGGVYVTPGCTSGPDATTDLARIFWNQLRIMGSTMGDARDFAEVAALYRRGAIKPVVDRVLAAREGAGVFDYLAKGEQFGKVVVDWRG